MQRTHVLTTSFTMKSGATLVIHRQLENPEEFIEVGPDAFCQFSGEMIQENADCGLSGDLIRDRQGNYTASQTTLNVRMEDVSAISSYLHEEYVTEETNE